jgi:hypothetical protein
MSSLGGSVVDLASESLELAFDVGRAPFTEDEYEGFQNTLLGIIQDNLIGGIMMSAIGPEGVGGEIIGGVIPEVVKHPVRVLVDEVLGPIDAFQDKWVERPLAFLAMTPAGRVGFGLTDALRGMKFEAVAAGLSGFLDVNAYKTAWQIADGSYDGPIELYNQPLSMGRAVALATMNVDLLDPRAVEEASQTAQFNLISGAVDFGETLLLDPLLIVGKPLQAARVGKLTLSAATDVPRILRRTGRTGSNLQPKRSLKGWERRTDELGERRFGWTNKLDETSIQNFTTARAGEVIASKNWQKLNAAIENLEVSKAIRLAVRGTDEWNQLIQQRATEIRELVGPKKIDSEVALGLSQATSSKMRENHYRFMMGDNNAYRGAQEAAAGMQTAFRTGANVVPGAEDAKPLLDEIARIDAEIEDARRILVDEMGEARAASADLREGGAWLRKELGDNIERLISERDGMLRQAREGMQPLNDWDFGFIFDLKTRFDARQLDDYATRASGQNGNPVARFLAANDDESMALADLAFDSWVDDAVGTGREILDVEAGLLRGLGDDVDDVKNLMRTRERLNREVYVPIQTRATGAVSGVAARVFTYPARFAKGTRTFEIVYDMVAQRLINFDDAPRAALQIERVIRDFKKVKFRNEEGVLVSLIDDAEAARLNGQYVQLVDEASRREFFSTMTSDFNKRIAKRVYGEDNASVALLAKELDDVVLGAEKMLAHARPGKGRYGSSPLNSQLTMTDRETGVVSRIVTALSPRQLMESRIVPRYDLIVQAIKKHGLESSDVSARSGLRNSRLGKHFPEKVGSYADASDIILGDAGKAVRAKLRKARRARPVSDPKKLHLADSIMGVWRPAVLLRPAWPMRVVGDEILRVASVVGAIGQLGALRHGFADYRVELLRRKGIDVDGEIVGAMQRELFPDAWKTEKALKEGDVDFGKLDELMKEAGIEDQFGVFESYVTKFGDEGATKFVEDLIMQQWKEKGLRRGLAWRGMLGYGLLGPFGAAGGVALGLSTQSRTVRRLAERSIGVRFSADLKRQANALLDEAKKSLSPEEAEHLQRAADLLETRSAKLDRILAVHYKDVPITNEAKMALQTMDRAGVKLHDAGRIPLLMGGVVVRNAFGDTKANQEIWRKKVSADRNAAALFEQGSRRVHNDLSVREDWKTITYAEAGSEAEFGRLWGRSANRQWKTTGDAGRPENEFLRLAWSNDTVNYETALLEFFGTTKGKKVLEALDIPDSDEAIEGLVGAVKDTTNNILPRVLDEGTVLDEFVELRDRMGTSGTDDIRWDEVRDVLNRSDRGEEIRLRSNIEQTTGPGDGVTPFGLPQRFQELTREAFDVLATLPTDNLTRNPLFRHHYQTEMVRRLSAYWDKDAGKYVIDEKTLGRLENEARNASLETVRYLLYDLTESTRLQEVTKNLTPFLGAYQEVISRWAGIAAENPAYVARVLDNYNSIPVVTDDQDNDWMLFRLPEEMGALADLGPDLPLAGALTKPFVGKEMRFSRDSMSMMSAGGPGFGPMALVPLSEIVIAEPELYDAVKFIFPYGLPQGTNMFDRAKGQFAPAWTKRLYASFTMDARERRSLTLQVAQSKEVRLRQQPAFDSRFPNRFAEILSTDRSGFMQDVQDEAQQLLIARAFASTITPTSLLVSSPYQAHIEQLRKMREEDPSTANERFIQEFGPEFWALTNRMTRSNNGMAPTLESWQALEDAGLRDLLEEYPQLGPLITGALGSATTGKFHEAAYRKQQSTPVTPGSQTMMREQINLEDFMESADVSQGWRNAGDIWAVRDAELARREQVGGSGSIHQNPDISAWVQKEIARNSGSHPAWYEAYTSRDPSEEVKTFQGLYQVVQNETMLLRPEIEVLVDYLADRKLGIEALADRKARGRSGNLYANSNDDLDVWWEATKREYQNIPEFSDLFNRLLEWDDLNPDTWVFALRERV